MRLPLRTSDLGIGSFLIPDIAMGRGEVAKSLVLGKAGQVLISL